MLLLSYSSKGKHEIRFILYVHMNALEFETGSHYIRVAANSEIWLPSPAQALRLMVCAMTSGNQYLLQNSWKMFPCFTLTTLILFCACGHSIKFYLVTESWVHYFSRCWPTDPKSSCTIYTLATIQEFWLLLFWVSRAFLWEPKALSV